jgi:hypothetical protein
VPVGSTLAMDVGVDIFPRVEAVDGFDSPDRVQKDVCLVVGVAALLVSERAETISGGGRVG